MAQLKSGSTVGGQTIATTAQVGSPTGENDIGAYRLGTYRSNQNYNQQWSYTRGQTVAGSQLGVQNTQLSGVSFSNSVPTGTYLTSTQNTGQQFAVGTWRVIGRNFRTNSNPDGDFPGNANIVGSLWMRIS